MPLNPYLSALAAAAYISLVGLLFQYLESTQSDTPDTFLDPVVLLSLLVFSVALMGFLFFYRPVILLLETKRSEAVSYFLKTLGTFGLITALLFVLSSLLP